MRQLAVEQDALDSKPLLSGQHAEFLSIGSSGRYFWCLRHLIERFGAGSTSGETTRQFARELSIATSGLSMLPDGGRFTREKVQSLCNVLGLGDSSGHIAIESDCLDPKGLWSRATHGVSSCYNHIEGLHSTINEAVSDGRLLNQRPAELIRCVNSKYQILFDSAMLMGSGSSTSSKGRKIAPICDNLG
jgi:hypothetical protein